MFDKTLAYVQNVPVSLRNPRKKILAPCLIDYRFDGHSTRYIESTFATFRWGKVWPNTIRYHCRVRTSASVTITAVNHWTIVMSPDHSEGGVGFSEWYVRWVMTIVCLLFIRIEAIANCVHRRYQGKYWLTWSRCVVKLILRNSHSTHK